MCIINKVSRSNSDRMVTTIEKITKMAAILKLYIMFNKIFDVHQLGTVIHRCAKNKFLA